ncbi:MAG: hypothetical protein AAB507_02150 [Patescibacteria group bacterium]
MNVKKTKKTLLGNIRDLGFSMLPELAGALTPEIVTNPEATLIKVGTAITSSKLKQFYNEWKEKKSKGEIKENIETEKDSFYDLLKFINENPDEKRLNAVKKLFFKAIAPNTDESEKLMVFELIQITKKLTTNDLSVLKAAYEIDEIISLKKSFDSIDGTILSTNQFRSRWFSAVAFKIGHKISSLVESSENHLSELKLIFSPRPTGESQEQYFTNSGHFRLTDLGFSLCKYLKS